MSVSISKDKHEEIMEKITNLFSTGDEKVSIEKLHEIAKRVNAFGSKTNVAG